MPGLNYQEIFQQFSHMTVMVIGDVMVDTYLIGRVDRISPEAPVPVVLVENRLNRLGGAANVALNLKALGAEPILCSVIGNDAKGDDFRKLLQEEKISPQGILSSDTRITTTKYRVIGNKAQMLRVDEEVTFDLDEPEQKELMEKIREILQRSKIDAIIFQDYNKGILTSWLIREVTSLAKSLKIPVAVDPKKKNFLGYKGVELFKPNLKELREGLGIAIVASDKEILAEAARKLHREQGISTVMITLSENGVFISQIQDNGTARQKLIPAHFRNISDVSGAGDTVISVAALCLACQLESAEIASLSNLAGGIVCEEVGVVPVNRDKLIEEATSLL